MAKFIDGHEYLFPCQNGKGHIQGISIYKTLERLEKRRRLTKKSIQINGDIHLQQKPYPK